MRGSLGRRITTLMLLASLLPATAYGQSEQDRSQARDYYQQGQAALEAKDYKRAEDSFRRGDALFHAPTLGLGLARAQAALGKFAEAWENYHRVLVENVTSTPAFAKALEDAKREIASVENRRSRVTITVSGSDAPRVTLDSSPLKVEALGAERFIDPGQHTLSVAADGFKPATRSFSVDEGKTATVSVALEKDTSAATAATPGATSATGPEGSLGGSSTSPQNGVTADVGTKGGSMNKTLGIVALGVGGAGVITGVITGLIALGKHSDLSNDPLCPNGTCSPTKQSDIDSYHTIGTISTVAFIVGGVGLGAGVVLLLTAPKAQAAPPATGAYVSPYVGFGTVGATGAF